MNAKEPIAVVESVKAASDIYSPVKGTVFEANKALEADPGLINREPYGQGWIFVLKIENPDDLKNLKDASAYNSHRLKPEFFQTPADFGTWLEKNHATATELWVGFYKKDSGKPSITWPESVDQALCFGGSTEFGRALTKSVTKFGSRHGDAAAFGAPSISSAPRSSLGKNKCDRPD